MRCPSHAPAAPLQADLWLPQSGQTSQTPEHNAKVPVFQEGQKYLLTKRWGVRSTWDFLRVKGKISTLQYFSSEQEVLLAGAGRALLLLIRCKGEVLSGMKITAIQALGDNSVFRVTSGALYSFFQFPPAFD